ncbi:MAG: EAL domain-containing protein [Gammaproteobacteria bacterium]
MKKRISTRYTRYIAMLLLAVVTCVLSVVVLIISNNTETFKEQIRSSFHSNQIVSNHQMLIRNMGYFNERLFDPLYNRDISLLNEEIRQIGKWLPIERFVITDSEGSVVTDGSIENPQYGRIIFLTDRRKLNQPTVENHDDRIELAMPVAVNNNLQGYAFITVSNDAQKSSMAALNANTRQIWRVLVQSIGLVFFSALVITIFLAWYSGHWLSRIISKPLSEMNEAAKAFAAGKLDYQLQVRSGDELGELAQSLNSMAADLYKTHLLLSKAQSIANLGSWEWRPGQDFIDCSENLLNVMGSGESRSRIGLKDFLRLIDENDRQKVAAVFRADRVPEAFSHEFRVLTPQGERFIHMRMDDGDIRDGQFDFLYGTIQDVTERRQVENRLSYLANFDALTGLPNRNLFQDRLQHATLKAKREKSQLALFFVDLNRFKSINDLFGHIVGDKVLQHVSNCLSEATRTSDTVARLSGDEFTLIIENVENEGFIVSVAEKLLEKLSGTLIYEGNEIEVTCSIGISRYPVDTMNMKELIRFADMAMYQAKETAGGAYCLFNREMSIQAGKFQALENDLRKSVKNREFALHYQPQIDLINGKPIGVEALLKWPRNGIPTPSDQFIPILEDSGLIVEVGEWVLEEACRQMAEWRRSGLGDLRLSINLSGKQFQINDFALTIKKVLEKNQLPPHLFEIEVTESVLIDLTLCEQVMEKLKSLGVRISVDDFGTGYSSLRYLKYFAVDTLKIDKIFIAEINRKRDDEDIASAIVSLAGRLGIDVIAEGIETLEQSQWLMAQGCRFGQGYLFGRPMPAVELDIWMKSREAIEGPPVLS